MNYLADYITRWAWLYVGSHKQKAHCAN